MEKDGTFPPRHKSTVGRVRWKREAVDEWIRENAMSLVRKAIRKIPYGCGYSIARVRGAVFVNVEPPKGLVLTGKGIGFYSHYETFVPHVLLGADLRLEQCPEFPDCTGCNCRLIRTE